MMETAGAILAGDQLAQWAEQRRSAGRLLVFTNGCFDLLHRGHLDSLNAAAALGDDLLVAINSDAVVRDLKGPGRPLLTAEDRAALLAALRVVTAVTIFAEPTPLQTIKRVKPAVLVKGAEYADAEIVGAPEVLAWGGRVCRVPMRAGWSTSRLIATIKGLP
jgi:rfaE bifunctional protein nucleotidyltransferase chain/domain